MSQNLLQIAFSQLCAVRGLIGPPSRVARPARNAPNNGDGGASSGGGTAAGDRFTTDPRGGCGIPPKCPVPPLLSAAAAAAGVGVVGGAGVPNCCLPAVGSLGSCGLPDRTPSADGSSVCEPYCTYTCIGSVLSISAGGPASPVPE
jgi:hypothetical protein